MSRPMRNGAERPTPGTSSRNAPDWWNAEKSAVYNCSSVSWFWRGPETELLKTTRPSLCRTTVKLVQSTATVACFGSSGRKPMVLRRISVVWAWTTSPANKRIARNAFIIFRHYAMTMEDCRELAGQYSPSSPACSHGIDATIAAPIALQYWIHCRRRNVGGSFCGQFGPAGAPEAPAGLSVVSRK